MGHIVHWTMGHNAHIIYNCLSFIAYVLTAPALQFSHGVHEMVSLFSSAAQVPILTTGVTVVLQCFFKPCNMAKPLLPVN
jgi:hypothetical protein